MDDNSIQKAKEQLLKQLLGFGSRVFGKTYHFCTDASAAFENFIFTHLNDDLVDIPRAGWQVRVSLES